MEQVIWLDLNNTSSWIYVMKGVCYF